MTRILTIAALLSIMATSPSWGDIYKCQFPDGRTFFTDSPELATADCKPERVELPPLSIMSDVPRSQTSAVPNTARATSSQASESKAKSFEAYKTEVSALVEQFEAARRAVFRSTLVKNKQVARRDLTDIRAQKTSLADEIKQSSLSRSEKQELQGSLATITE
jgi:hypothetical protein